MILALTMVFTSVDITAFAQQNDDTVSVSTMEVEAQEMTETPESTEKSVEATVEPTAEGENIEPAESPTVVPATVPEEQETISPEVTPEPEKTMIPETVATETPEETTISETISEESATPSVTSMTGAEMEDLVSTVTASGQCGDNLTWTLEEGILSIVGEGEMWGADYEHGYEMQWDKCASEIKEVQMAEGITSIGDYAFASCSNLSGSINLPSSLEKIGGFAFYNCSYLEGNLDLPKNVKEIKCGAFWGCKGLTGDLIIPNKVTVIEACTFENCSGFNGNLVISDSVTSIESGAFKNCNGFIGNLILPSNLLKIEDEAFYNCNGFSGDLKIPDGVTQIGDRAFAGCEGFDGELSLSKSLVNIKTRAFDGCSRLRGTLEIGDDVIEIADDAFSECGFDGELILGNSLVQIGRGAFQYCGNFKGDLVIPQSVTEIGACAFESCGFNGELVLSENLEVINTGVFCDCKGLSGNLLIPDNITAIGDNAFDGCENFEGDLLIPDSIVDIGAMSFYQCANLSGNLIIGDGVKSIGNFAFEGCGFAGDLVLGNGLTKINDLMFYGCENFTGKLILGKNIKELENRTYSSTTGIFHGNFEGDLTIPDGLVYIGDYAFDGATFSGNLVIPNSVEYIGINAFSACGFIGDLTIPESITYINDDSFSECNFSGELRMSSKTVGIGSGAFAGCDGLTGILNIPDTVENIGSGAFSGCSGFRGELIIPENVTILEDDVFAGCSGFTGSLVIPSGVTYIGGGTFSGCSGFSGDLIIPNNVEHIGGGALCGGAFENCSGFDGDLVIGDGVKEIDKNTFSGCSGFGGSLIIGNGIKEIDDKLFKDCRGFKGKLILGNGVESIYSTAFSGSSFTGDLVIPNSVTGIGYKAFSGCDGFNGKLVLSNSISEIKMGTFLGCSGFVGDLTIPDGVESIGSSAFENCSGFNGKIKLSDNLQSISGSAFSGCENLIGDLDIPQGVREIGKEAFFNCKGISGNLRLPDGVATIGSGAFYGCTGLNMLIIPKQISDIGLAAFSECDGIDIVVFEGNKPSFGVPESLQYNVFDGVTAKAYYPVNNSTWSSFVTDNFEKENIGTNITWISYEEGTTPWEMNYSKTAPTIWFTFETNRELEYSESIGYNFSQFNMNLSALCMIPLDNSDPTYENVTITIELPESLSFSAEAEERSMQKNLGTMSLSGTKRQDMSFTVYIDEAVIKDEFLVDVKLTADGYETPQTNTYKIPVSIVVEKADETIVDTVERYTSDKEVQEISDIFNNSSSDEEIRQRLFEYYNYDNMLDVRERIIELGDMHDERWDYEGLIRDDMYLSWQYYNYLNHTPKGAAARVAIYASGLVFNGEINDWIDPSTYIDSELPGIKKYKSMLEEFIQKQSSSIELYSYVSETEKFINSSVGVWSKTEKAEVIKKLKDAPDSESCKSIFNHFVANKVSFGEETMTFVYDGEKPVFMEAMGITDTIFSVINVTMDSISGLVDVSSNLETYEVYHSFLQEIYESDDLPWELVVAAYQLDKELEQAYWTPIKGILDEIRDKCLGEAFDAAGFENLLNKNGWLSAINYTAFCINQFVDVGAMVVNSCHTEGYAFLAMHYKNKLEQCKQQFLANKTEENAWAFYEAYVMLWKLRIAGEEKFLQMSNLEGGTVVDGLSEAATGGTIAGLISDLCGYADKEAAVNSNLQMLEGFAFKYSIKNENLPDEYKYLQKIVIECPVSVEILTSDGTQVCVLNDGVETEITNEHGTFVSFYRATTGDYAKIAYFNSDAPYVIRAIGQNSGEVTYSFARTEDHQTYTVAGFDKVNISEKDIINITTNEEKYIVDEGGDGTDDIEGEQADKSKIFVQFDYQDGKQIRVAYADANGMITLPEAPAREGYEFKGWFEDLAGLENEFTGDTIVSKSITVYAKWESKEVKVLSTPAANIVSGSEVEKGTEIILTCSEEGVHIFYTLDGTMPTEESAEYITPIIIDKETTIKAIAVKEGFKNSEVAAFTYTVKENTGEDQGDILSEDVLPEDIPSDGIIPDGIWLSGITDKTYTGTGITQSFRVYDGKKRLQEKTDYTITYKNNKNACTYADEDYAAFEENLKATGKRVKTGTFDPAKAPQATIRMKGNYSGSQTIYFRIEPADITGEGFAAGDLAVTWNGKKQTPAPTLTRNGRKLKYGTDFHIPEYDNAKNDKGAFTAQGTYNLTVKGKGNFTGEIPVTLTISEGAKQIAMDKVTVKGIKNLPWTGEQLVQNSFKVSYKKDVLSEAAGDYTVSWGTNTDVGTGALTLTGTGLDEDGDGYSYIGTKTVSFRITGTPMSKVAVEGLKKEYTYTGEAIRPETTLTYKADNNAAPVPLEEGIHYTVSYEKNTDKGTAAIIFTGLAGGGYTGTKKVTFRIVPSGIADKKEGENLIEQVSVTFKDTENLQNGIYTAPYMKGGAKPEVVVSSGEKTLTPGKDYTVSYANNKKAALSTDAKAPSVTIKGKGNYTGSKTVSFSIKAKPLSNENGITVSAKDKVASTKKNGYRQSFKVYDADGAALGSGDYDSKNVIYTLIQTENADGTVNAVNEVLDKDSVVPANSVVRITVQGKGVYAGGTATGTYRILESSHDISRATIRINDQSYTGKPVLITEQSQFKTGKVFIRIGRETKALTLGEDIEVVPDSYVKNVNKGTAKVTFRGINDFGGTKTVSFRIGTRSIGEFWKGIYTKVANLFG